MLRGIFWLYGFALLSLIAVVYGLGERFWPVTLFLFGPRWVVALPLAVLIPASLLVDRRMLLPVLLCAAVVLFPLLGFRVPIGALGRSGEAGLRVVTWNVGSGFRRAELDALLTERAPDVVVLQECHAEDVDLPSPWETRHDSGMCLLSRFPVRSTQSRDRHDMWTLAGSGAIVRYVIETPEGLVDLTNLHLETPREGLEDILASGLSGVPTLQAKNAQRELEAEVARRWVDRSPDAGRLVAGDFNTPVESDVFRRHWSGFRDCFERAGLGFGFTKYTRKIGTRIDHVLAGPGWRCVGATVDRNRGTDHRPLVVDLERSNGT